MSRIEGQARDRAGHDRKTVLFPDRTQRDRGDECSCPACTSPGCAPACECKACREARPLVEALDLGELAATGHPGDGRQADDAPADADLLNRPDPDFTHDEARRAGQKDMF